LCRGILPGVPSKSAVLGELLLAEAKSILRRIAMEQLVAGEDMPLTR
jgi:hypothetical protein